MSFWWVCTSCATVCVCAACVGVVGHIWRKAKQIECGDGANATHWHGTTNTSSIFFQMHSPACHCFIQFLVTYLFLLSPMCIQSTAKQKIRQKMPCMCAPVHLLPRNCVAIKTKALKNNNCQHSALSTAIAQCLYTSDERTDCVAR